MLTKVLAASALVLGLASTAMAQSSDESTSQVRHRPVWSEQRQVDTSTTSSIGDNSGLNTLGNPGAVGPCAYNTAGPDANAGQNVNDQYCGK